jgi:branched-chain amino acid transport system ATP-binding protein
MSVASGELSIERVSSAYDRGSPVLKAVSLTAAPAQITALIGANGAGKSSLLKTAMGYLAPLSGRILFNGQNIVGLRPDLICARGIGYLMEGHSIFPSLTVEENLLLGMWPRRRERERVASALATAYDKAPVLHERRHTAAGLLSGGQQRILELERLYMMRPSLVLMDEPSLGLAPKLAEAMFRRVLSFRDDGITVLLIDQNVRRVVELADRVYVLQLGEIKLEGTGRDLSANIEQIVKEFI